MKAAFVTVGKTIFYILRNLCVFVGSAAIATVLVLIFALLVMGERYTYQCFSLGDWVKRKFVEIRDRTYIIRPEVEMAAGMQMMGSSV